LVKELKSDRIDLKNELADFLLLHSNPLAEEKKNNLSED
jgi:hypothetical protein